MKDIVRLVEYDRWANREVLRAVSALSEEEFTRELGSSFASIRQTLVHLLWAERLWLERWRGGSRIESPNRAAPLSNDELVRALDVLHEDQSRSLRNLAGDEADRLVRYVNEQGQTWTYPLREIVQHVVVHSAFHRGQVATLLRQLGKVPPHTDFLVYVDIKANG